MKHLEGIEIVDPSGKTLFTLNPWDKISIAFPGKPPRICAAFDIDARHFTLIGEDRKLHTYSSGEFAEKFIAAGATVKPLRRFMVPVTWEMCGTVYAHGETLEEAVEAVRNDPDRYPLPNDGEYIDSSFQVTDDPDLLMTKSINGMQ